MNEKFLLVFIILLFHRQIIEVHQITVGPDAEKKKRKKEICMK